LDREMESWKWGGDLCEDCGEKKQKGGKRARTQKKNKHSRKDQKRSTTQPISEKAYGINKII